MKPSIKLLARSILECGLDPDNAIIIAFRVMGSTPKKIDMGSKYMEITERGKKLLPRLIRVCRFMDKKEMAKYLSKVNVVIVDNKIDMFYIEQESKDVASKES